ncbi:ParB N-terminal domain-containing protein [Kitasatospora sp. NPDC059327]|uniref:ParB/RepB/Spo0J family partition protein n=1 Tax=Kitasatospora sp. NPDC059327 TaxID=3346803 RepID=UPI003680292B
MTATGNSTSTMPGIDPSDPRRVPLDVLKPSDSPRARRQDEEHVRKLADSDWEFEPVLVHRDTMRVIDGMHRLSATALRGRREIAVRFFDGSEADAYVLSVQLNVRHGLPLTPAERRLAAGRILRSHPHWSDRAIAERTGLSGKTVGKLRRSASADIPQSHTRTGRDGTVRPLSSAEGRRIAAALLAEDPGASLRELARGAGVSTGTVRDVRDRLRRGESPVPQGRRDGAGPTAVPPRLPRQRTVERSPGEAPSADVAADLASAALRKLIRDPALKATDSGRLLLRALLTTELTPDQWERIADALPPHSVPLVHVAAARRSAEWSALADALAQRARGAA